MHFVIEPSWKKTLAAEFSKPYFTELTRAVEASYKLNEAVYPSTENIFRAFALTPFSQVRVVIIGQDPYHGPNQAHGLAFSVPSETPIPPSLRNIFTEITTDTGATLPTNGNLERWVKQGVLLLNSTLTVQAGAPGSHQSFGWEQFTDAVISTISTQKEHVVFLLWGACAQRKQTLIDTSKHHILTAPHPSPLSAYRGFFGCQHFSMTNTYLKKHHLSEIEW